MGEITATETPELPSGAAESNFTTPTSRKIVNENAAQSLKRKISNKNRSSLHVEAFLSVDDLYFPPYNQFTIQRKEFD